MKSHHHIAAAAVLFISVCGAARADLIVQEEGKTPRQVKLFGGEPAGGIKGISGSSIQAENPALASSVVSHIGTPGEASIVNGFGKGVSLGAALKEIVPAGWKGYVTDGRVKSLTEVDWYGLNRPWTDVFEQFMIRYELVGTIDWKKKEISIGAASYFTGK